MRASNSRLPAIDRPCWVPPTSSNSMEKAELGFQMRSRCYRNTPTTFALSNRCTPSNSTMRPHKCFCIPAHHAWGALQSARGSRTDWGVKTKTSPALSSSSQVGPIRVQAKALGEAVSCPASFKESSADPREILSSTRLTRPAWIDPCDD